MTGGLAYGGKEEKTSLGDQQGFMPSKKRGIGRLGGVSN